MALGLTDLIGQAAEQIERAVDPSIEAAEAAAEAARAAEEAAKAAAEKEAKRQARRMKKLAPAAETFTVKLVRGFGDEEPAGLREVVSAAGGELSLLVGGEGSRSRLSR